MSETSERYARLSGAYTAKVEGVPADRWQSPSPCEGWTALDLVRHQVDTHKMFLGFVGRTLDDVPPVDDDPAAAWGVARRTVQADLDDPERASAGFEGFFGPTTFEAAVDRFLNFDLIAHGWDLARATGQDERIDPEDIRWLTELIPTFGDALRGPGALGAALEPPDGADDQTKLLALLGRHSWA